MSDDEARATRGRGKSFRKRSRGRAYCFTYNNPDGVPTLATFGEHARYLVYGHEVGERGTEHLQGYVAFDTPIDFTTVCRKLPEAHFEIAKGSAEENRVYCTKDGIFVEEGEIPQQGVRSDLNGVVTAIRQQGYSMKRVAEEFPEIYIRTHRGIKAWKTEISPKRDSAQAITIRIIIGPSGSGKTRAAVELGGPDAYWKFPGKWWDGYDGEKTVVWDEFRGGSYVFSELLRVLDRHPMKVETKGGVVELLATNFIFTSNIEPAEWYNPESVHYTWANSPLHRRIQEFGRVYHTGDVHVMFQTKKGEVLEADQEHLRWCLYFQRLGNNAAPIPAPLAEDALYVDEEGKVRIRGG